MLETKTETSNNYANEAGARNADAATLLFPCFGSPLCIQGVHCSHNTLIQDGNASPSQNCAQRNEL